MKSKYFTKYLPVEGEIKNGDKAQYNTGEIISYDAPVNTDNLKRVKLFLCSRDIQVGDKVYISPSSSYEVSSINDGFIYFGPMSIRGKVGKSFKVIGEISPDALSYVKEGDEFEDKDLKFYLLKEEFRATMDLKTIKSFVGNSGKNTGVLVKGPCGHFH